MAPAAQALASSLSISPQPVMPASVEILTNTQEFFRTKVSILVTLMLSFGPTAAASVRSAVKTESRPNSPAAPARLRSNERRLRLALNIDTSVHLHTSCAIPRSSGKRKESFWAGHNGRARNLKLELSPICNCRGLPTILLTKPACGLPMMRSAIRTGDDSAH